MNAPTDNLGLDDSDDDLASLLKPNPASTPAPVSRSPLMIAVDLVDEDDENKRTADNPGFRPESIAELASSFGPLGPKTPLSLRDNPDRPGRYIINHGHRRYRACNLLKLAELPAFVDNDYSDDDQMIENIQREDLTPWEIAVYIGRKESQGVARKDIAKRLGKSASWVTQYAALNNLPEPIAAVFHAGKVSDITVVSELVKAYKESPEDVKDWLNVPGQEITRGGVKLLREWLAEKSKAGAGSRDPDTVDLVSGKTDTEAGEGEQGTAASAPKPRETDPEKLRKAIVQVEHDGRAARLMLTKRPPAEGYAWMKYEDDGQEFEASLADVKLLAVLEG
jgi:ParB family chromosome partitioning protein